jgi:hypothetical protein
MRCTNDAIGQRSSSATAIVARYRRVYGHSLGLGSDEKKKHGDRSRNMQEQVCGQNTPTKTEAQW